MMAKSRKTIAHRERTRRNNVRESVVGYNPNLAVLYGQFVDSVYQMYEKYPGNPTPPALALPAGYKLIAWVQMMDFIIVGGDWTFYGLIAQSTTDANNFVLAIRGTENLEEWFDDLTSTVLVPWENFGNVGYGFSRIYQTLRSYTRRHSAARLQPIRSNQRPRLHIKWPRRSSVMPPT